MGLQHASLYLQSMRQSNLTDHHHTTSDQHVELAKSRCERDLTDFEKILQWFETRDPFNMELPMLRSLTTGLTATDEDGINCDQTEEVGEKIQQSLNGVILTRAKIKRSAHVRTLQHLQAGVKVGKNTIHIEPAVLFMRCTLLAQQNSEDIELYFSHELSAIPTTLFKDGFMCKTDKSELAREIKS